MFVIVSRALAPKVHYKHRRSLCLNVSSLDKRHNNIFIVHCVCVSWLYSFFLWDCSSDITVTRVDRSSSAVTTICFSGTSLLHSVCISESLGHIGWYLIISKSGICQSCTSWREDEGQIRLAVKTRLMNEKRHMMREEIKMRERSEGAICKGQGISRTRTIFVHMHTQEPHSC